MNIFKKKDFTPYFNGTDSIVAAEIANQVLEPIIKELLRDPTNQANGEVAEGYRAALKDIEIHLKERYHS